jgi:hypothetical protein
LELVSGTTNSIDHVTGDGSLHVAAGTTLNAISINVDTLTIGGAPHAAAAAVPEPSAFVLLALAGLGSLLAWCRK